MCGLGFARGTHEARGFLPPSSHTIATARQLFLLDSVQRPCVKSEVWFLGCMVCGQGRHLRAASAGSSPCRLRTCSVQPASTSRLATSALDAQLIGKQSPSPSCQLGFAPDASSSFTAAAWSPCTAAESADQPYTPLGWLSWSVETCGRISSSLWMSPFSAASERLRPIAKGGRMW
eukprot:scaffold15997_cov55-Phaeocystis_antarctica.AAC.2